MLLGYSFCCLFKLVLLDSVNAARAQVHNAVKDVVKIKVVYFSLLFDIDKKAQRQEAEVPQDAAEHEESVPTPSNDPQPSGEDTLQLTDLMVLCTKLQTQVLDLQKAKDAQAKEIVALKKRIQRLERRKMSRPTGLKRLKKVGMSRRVESSEDQESLGAPEDASKQGRCIEDINADVDVSLVDKTQERQDDDLMFDTGVLEDDEMHVEAKVDGKDEQSTKPDDSTAGESVTTASVDDSVVPTTIEEITLAQTLIQIKAAKPKVVTTAATTTTTTRPKDKGVVVQEPSEFRVPQEIKPSSSKDKGKGIMIDLKKQEEEANIALIESWENTQAMMEADRLLAERLQSKEREELTDEEKAKLFMELMEKRRKHFAALRAQEKRNRPPTKAQKRTQMSTYLKHMGGYTYKQLKGKSFDEIQKLFDKEMKRVNTFVAMGSEVQENKEKKEEGREETAKGSRKKMLGRKRAVKEQQEESSKKQKVEEEKESEEVEEDDEVELKKLLVIKKDEDIAIDAIPLATKLPVIIEYKLHKEGMLVHYELIRADGSSKRYSSMIRMLQGIDREDLEALWRIVKGKYGDTRPEDEFERVLYGDLRVMFEPDIKSDVWRMLQGYRVTTWKLIDSSGVHFVRFDNLHIFMLVERRYPLTPITITNMLNKKLQTDHQNEMCYQLLKLMIQKMNIKFKGGLLGLKRLHGFLKVTAAQVHNGNYTKWIIINILTEVFLDVAGTVCKDEGVHRKLLPNGPDENTHTMREDDIAFYDDSVRFLTTASGSNRLKEALEDSAGRQRDENPIRTLGDYSRPSHEGYRNTIELPNGNNVVPLSAYIDSRLDNIEQFLNGFINPPNEINMDDLGSDNESVYTPLVSPFLDSDDNSDDCKVLNELEEYRNAGKLCHRKVINNIDGDDLAFPCMIGFRKFVAYFDPFLPMNIITRKAYNTILVEGLKSTGRKLVDIVRDVYVFVGSFTYVTDFVVLKDIGEFIVNNLVDVVMGRPFRAVTQLEYDCAMGLISFSRIFNTTSFRMPLAIPRLKNFSWRVVKFTNRSDEISYMMPHKIEQYISLSNLEKEHMKSIYFMNEEDKRRGVEYVMNKILGLYKECLELGPENLTGLEDEGEVT
ncbi:hypothetical protein Tco_1244815 [Tanacetum coccineum]